MALTYPPLQIKNNHALLTMTKTFPTLIFVCFFGLFASACDSTNPGDTPEIGRALTEAEQHIIAADNSFGMKLFQALHADAPDENVFISPLSISMALGMTLNGADGDTRDEMAEILEKSGLSEQDINESYLSLIELLSTLDNKVAFDIANSIWYREGFSVKDEFLAKNRTYFLAEIAALDFNKQEAVDEINAWVDTNTNGLIDKIIESIDPETLMYLINAVYFKGDWTYQFDPDFTQEESFFNVNDAPSMVDMMSLRGAFQYYSSDRAAFIDLPYGDSLFTMSIVLPHTTQDMQDLLEGTQQDILTTFDANKAYTTLDVYLPKFQLEYKKSLNQILQTLGIRKAFIAQQADFSRINDERTLYISEAIHKTFIEVSEEGTEAAAVTAIGIGTTSVGDPLPPVMRVDKPFLFIIRENNSGAYLFAGKINTL